MKNYYSMTYDYFFFNSLVGVILACYLLLWTCYFPLRKYSITSQDLLVPPRIFSNRSMTFATCTEDRYNYRDRIDGIYLNGMGLRDYLKCIAHPEGKKQDCNRPHSIIETARAVSVCKFSSTYSSYKISFQDN